MTAIAWVFAAVFGAAAGANWWSRWTGHRPTELWSKPLALGALIGVAATLDPLDPAVRAWFVVALVGSLAGDVLLLDGDRRFVPGLVAFLLAHIAYTVGLVVSSDWSWIGFAIGAAAAVALAATVGVRIVRAARRAKPVLGPAVSAYLVAISTMFCAAVATGHPWAIAGAGLFVASDSVLGWRQFVGSAPWMPVTVMVTYHLGQAGLVASLVWG
ncbi:MAG TPA: lysoplasmalogenase [Ilumatobacteraceae bacterium]|nr:lysoplasmalogenase [Ilumatobacteraceae bacterium]